MNIKRTKRNALFFALIAATGIKEVVSTPNYSMVSDEIFDYLEDKFATDGQNLAALHQVFTDLYTTLNHLTSYRQQVYADYKLRLRHDRDVLNNAKATLAEIIQDGTNKKLALQIEIDDTTKQKTKEINDLNTLITNLNTMIYELHQSIDTLEDLGNRNLERVNELVDKYSIFNGSRENFRGDMDTFLDKVRTYLGQLSTDDQDMSDFADQYNVEDERCNTDN